ncbi:MAG TPA: hypothetical protein DEP87_03720 [Candidatus Pacebacteria bacterium]|nr:hypothetical protein [Candidatus Paceibacterota bacterium]
MFQALKTGEITQIELRKFPESLVRKYALTDFQVSSSQKFFSEYSFSSFFEWLQERKIRVITQLDSDYPKSLRELKLAPPVLWFQSQSNHWPIFNKSVAVIGSRHPTSYGTMASQLIVDQLVNLGCLVVSGAMFGADLIAQNQALAAGGQTVGILGYGLDRRYPVSFRSELQNYFDHGGGLLSPFPPWAEPRAWRFLARNQLVAALSQAVIVTEALPRSGTHSTMAAAAELGRVGAVLPSPITSPFVVGVSVLLEQGAILLHSASQLVAEIPTWQVPVSTHTGFFAKAKLEIPPKIAATQLQTQLQAALKLLPQSAAELADQLDLPLTQVIQQLVLLELNCQIQREGNLFRCR